MHFALTIVICIALALLSTLLAKRLRFPSVVALIILGIVIGSPLIKKLIIEPNSGGIMMISNYALICLMFLAGLEVSWTMLYKEERDSLFVAFFAAIVPFLLGAGVFISLGFSLETAMSIGVCMSITAEATKARVLIGLKKLNTKLGALMMGAGIIDDVIGLSLFSLISYSFAHMIPVEDLVTLALVIMAFFMGILAHKVAGRTTSSIRLLENILLYTVVPFLFIGVGLHFSMMSLILNPAMLLVIVLIAIIGKIGGTLVTRPFTGLRWKQLYLVGWGMNSRGAVELGLAFIAFRAGLLPIDVYSALVLMTITTTLLFPIIITRMLRNEPKIMG